MAGIPGFLRASHLSDTLYTSERSLILENKFVWLFRIDQNSIHKVVQPAGGRQRSATPLEALQSAADQCTAQEFEHPSALNFRRSIWSLPPFFGKNAKGWTVRILFGAPLECQATISSSALCHTCILERRLAHQTAGPRRLQMPSKRFARFGIRPPACHRASARAHTLY